MKKSRKKMKDRSFDERVKFMLNNYINEHIFGENNRNNSKIAEVMNSFSEDEELIYKKALAELDPFVECIEKDRIINEKLEENFTLETFNELGKNYFLMEKYARKHGFVISLIMMKEIIQCPECAKNTHSDGHTHR